MTENSCFIRCSKARAFKAESHRQTWPSQLKQESDFIIFRTARTNTRICHTVIDSWLYNRPQLKNKVNTPLMPSLSFILNNCLIENLHFCKKNKNKFSRAAFLFSSLPFSPMNLRSVFWCQVCGLKSSAVILWSFHLRGIDSYSELATASSQMNPALSAARRDEASWLRLAQEHAPI